MTKVCSYIVFMILPIMALCEGHENKDEITTYDRIQVDFPDAIKTAMMTRMRRNLADVHSIQNALANKDFDTAANVAEFSLGLSSLGPHNARQSLYMPEAMRQLGMETHKASSRVALAAQEGDAETAFKRLSEVTALCVSCHATYRAK